VKLAVLYTYLAAHLAVTSHYVSTVTTKVKLPDVMEAMFLYVDIYFSKIIRRYGSRLFLYVVSVAICVKLPDAMGAECFFM
jgi:hypothetical protein